MTSRDIAARLSMRGQDRLLNRIEQPDERGDGWLIAVCLAAIGLVYASAWFLN